MKTLELTVIRDEFGSDHTQGQFFVEDIRFADSMEPTDRNLSAGMSLSELKAKKVIGKTAIPYGRYRITWAVSPKFKDRSYAKPYGGKFPLLNGVPNWSGVLIHPMNYGYESEGCIGVGERWKAGVIINSTQAYKDLMDFYLVPAFKRGQEVWITIKKK